MDKSLATRRPAETITGIAGSIAFLLGVLLHLESDVVLALVPVISALPAAVTWFVELRRRSDA